MKTRVKYMPQYPLSAASSTNTTNSFDNEFVGQKRAQKAAYIRLCTYIGVTLSVVALVTCSILFMLLLSNNNPTQQSQEVQDLKDQLEFQNQRLHRMQKELQFMLSRQKTQEAKEDSVRRLERLFSPESRRDWSQLSALAVNAPPVAPAGVQTISQQAFAGLNPAEDGDDDQSEEDDDEEETLVLQPDVVIDVNQLPLAPPDKRRGGGKVWPSLPLASFNDKPETLPALPELKPEQQPVAVAQEQANVETSETEESEEEEEIEPMVENKANKALGDETDSNVEEDIQAGITVTQTEGSESRTEEEDDESDEDE